MAGPTDLEEFELIARYFAPLSGEAGLGLLDDAACFSVPHGKDVVISKDMLVANVHFFATDVPGNIAFKALSANVSDIVAKGASPVYYLLGLSLPSDINHAWLADFSSGLAEAQNYYDIELAGGDTTSTKGPLTLSVTIFGYVESGQMIKRSGAMAGDDIYVSGTIGDAALGLKSTQGKCPSSEVFIQRFNRPLARASLGKRLIGAAHAAADISDGLLADIGHICKASSCGARLHVANIPLSEAARGCLSKDATLWPAIWAGGDDYEIVFTAPVTHRNLIKEISDSIDVSVTRIGTILKGSAVELVDLSGETVQIDQTGYKHF